MISLLMVGVIYNDIGEIRSVECQLVLPPHRFLLFVLNINDNSMHVKPTTNL
jgi:hypothetical protein